MARRLGIQYPGAVYHVMNRGDRREAIFRDSKDDDCFLPTLAEACEKARWQIHACCLMPNHFLARAILARWCRMPLRCRRSGSFRPGSRRWAGRSVN